MKNLLLLCSCFLLFSACANDAYKLKISNNMADAHGHGVYFRSSIRNSYAGEIRKALSNKFAQMGIRTATSTDNADYIAIFDIETFYKQDTSFKNTSMADSYSDKILFSGENDGETLFFSGNKNINVDTDRTCFTLNIGKKNTSDILYASTFCANEIIELEEFVPYVVDVYSKFATYKNANIGVQCINSASGKISCDTINDRQKAFINSLWTDSRIKQD